jgi:heme/copper-type cytochrome/quinol oxidase subunit 3
VSRAIAVPAQPPIDKGVLGLLFFLGTEVMFFAGLISAYIVLRAGSPVWPPPGQPRLPIEVTGLNTVVLLLSAVTMHFALRAARRDRRSGLVGWLTVTALLGALFLAVQGYEWVRLVGFGMSLSSGVFGGTFYALIGSHGVHVLGAVVALLFVLGAAVKGRYTAADHSGVVLCEIYWMFVVALWPLLYLLVYLV